MKKLAILICFLLLMLIITACGTQKSADTPNSESTTEIIESNTPSIAESSNSPENPSESGTATTPESSAAGTLPGDQKTTSPPEPSFRSTDPPASKTPSSLRTTSTPSSATPATSSPPSDPPKPTESAAPVYTQKDYDDIISAVRAYAENQPNLKFIWDPGIKMDEFHGYHGTPCLNQLGKDGVITELKYHVDLTVDNLTGGNGGVPSTTVDYNIIWYEQNNQIFFVLLYG